MPPSATRSPSSPPTARPADHRHPRPLNTTPARRYGGKRRAGELHGATAAGRTYGVLAKLADGQPWFTASDTKRSPSPRSVRGRRPLFERRAGLAPAFPRRKRGVFPWTTNAAPADRSWSDQLKIHYSRWKEELEPDAAGVPNPFPNPEGVCESAWAPRPAHRPGSAHPGRASGRPRSPAWPPPPHRHAIRGMVGSPPRPPRA
jgi:hypothetical protein